jgi:hypothetical protein
MIATDVKALFEQAESAPTDAPSSRGAAPALYLGPALVLALPASPASGRLDVQLAEAPGTRVSAQLALPIPYRPALGDLLLVVGRGERHYAIGVLAGTGTTSLSFPGDVELRALGGELQLTGDAGIKLRSPETTIETGVLRTVATEVSERATRAFRWIRETLHVRAGASRSVVEGDDVRQAKRATILAEEVVKIDGGQVQLGH